MILVNGRKEEWYKGMTISDLIKIKKFTYPGIIYRINGKTIMEEDYEKAVIEDNDDVKAIHLCHGG